MASVHFLREYGIEDHYRFLMGFRPYEKRFKALKMVTGFKEMREFEEARLASDLNIPLIFINAGQNF